MSDLTSGNILLLSFFSVGECQINHKRTEYLTDPPGEPHCGIFTLWGIYPVGYLPCGVFTMRCVYAVGYLPCGVQTNPRGLHTYEYFPTNTQLTERQVDRWKEGTKGLNIT